MIKYEIIKGGVGILNIGVRILDIGSIERGCGLIFEGKTGSILSTVRPIAKGNYIYIYGSNRGLDNCPIFCDNITMVTDLLDEYNASLNKIKYEVTTQDGRPAVRILAIRDIERGCGSVYVGKYGSIQSLYHPEYDSNIVYIHGTRRDLDDDYIVSDDIWGITQILDEYNDFEAKRFNYPPEHHEGPQWASGSIGELQSRIHQDSINAGWYSDLTGKPIKRNFGEQIALIHSELSEALEGWRKDLMDEHLPDRSMVEVELADAVIRILDVAGSLDLDIAGAIAEKLEYNKNRSDHKIENRLKKNGKKI